MFGLVASVFQGDSIKNKEHMIFCCWETWAPFVRWCASMFNLGTIFFLGRSTKKTEHVILCHPF
ncbi:uncharacterized protein LACBIDRAFT_308515 [Laccaria bicolor S238N-H82]|uniref:Predicted protein n=1 Tax=Laccaria bicolor (strain S238N-H82 / ATCC MYA-4686) TaxID=486041 RepID=B0CWI9_LACBS|nr:uncharacterized protein LACBIDRAFT_308515 [Laccaria bicolor S238N-H82]EDR13517.1 predicted protein [Laccaria bicolor S238N-H82]|eukprot:XP_001876015.1 predicted protein [Laccaria bicolor S238N-H82]